MAEIEVKVRCCTLSITESSLLTRQILMKFRESRLASVRNQAVSKSGKKAAAAGSTRLRPIHFSNRAETAARFSAS